MSLRVLLAIVLSCCVARSQASAQSGIPGSTMRHTMELGSRTRTYFLHAPPNLPTIKTTALVFVFHGEGSNASRMEKITQFSPLADREGFLVVYPEAVSKNWNDGSESPATPSQIERQDDVSFVDAMIVDIGRIYPVSKARIFATGISSGAIFSHYLASELAGRIAAIAPVAGGIRAPYVRKFNPALPVSVLVINGTRDPLLPYHGGACKMDPRGQIIDTDEAARIWRERDDCDKEAVTGDLPDADHGDNCTVHWSRWSHGKNATEVVLYMIEGGGHTWPGGPQYQPAYRIGRVCRDFDATAAIWEFFRKHPRR